MNPLYVLLGGLFLAEVFAVRNLILSLQTSITRKKNLHNSRVDHFHKRIHPSEYWKNIGIQVLTVIVLIASMALTSMNIWTD